MTSSPLDPNSEASAKTALRALSEPKLREELRDAECCLATSTQALRTHGYQGITWALLRADAMHVEELRAEIQRRKGRK